jgi:GT2 family glycosyltransferase
MIAVSVVSHHHGAMVARLVARLLMTPEVAQVIVTCNVPEALELPADARLRVIDNLRPKGFGANHNAAFAVCDAPFFCVLNPDIALPENPFPALFACLAQTGAALAAPRVLAPDGALEDSARRFPTLIGLARKAAFGERDVYPLPANSPGAPDWVAGMFMLWRREAFAALGGFDEGFFLYYEDVDLCARAWASGRAIALCPEARAIHDARRESHRDLRFMRWHLASMARYFIKHAGRRPRQ